MGVAWGIDIVVNGFTVDDPGLVDRFVEGGEIKGLVFVTDVDLAKMIFMDGDLRFAQSIARPLRLDLVDDIFVMDG